ncbi:hypothetical protein RSAG8_04598, partial [Rhizoctonia solani AG-8 WAC10335]
MFPRAGYYILTLLYQIHTHPSLGRIPYLYEIRSHKPCRRHDRGHSSRSFSPSCPAETIKASWRFNSFTQILRSCCSTWNCVVINGNMYQSNTFHPVKKMVQI